MQTRTDITNTPFIREISGGAYGTSGAVIKQNAARAGDLVFGTVLGRSAVVAGAVTPDGGNTGDGVVDEFAVSGGPVIAIPGNYNLECIEAVAEGGIFKLEDPNGVIVAEYLPMNTGSGGSVTFDIGGLTFQITDGAADFIVGDKFALAVAADSDYVPFAPDGVGGAQNIVGIYVGQDIAEADIQAGDVTNKLVLLGGNLTVTADDVVLDDGASDLDTVLPSGRTVKEELRLLGIFTEDTVAISGFENS